MNSESGLNDVRHAFDIRQKQGRLLLVDGEGHTISEIIAGGVDSIVRHDGHIDILMSSGKSLSMRSLPKFNGNFVRRRRNGTRVLYFPNDDFQAVAAVVCGMGSEFYGVVFKRLIGYHETDRCVSLGDIANGNISATIVVKRREDAECFSQNHSLEFVVLEDGRDCVPCHMYMLCVNSFGDVFACCRQLKNLVIGNLREDDISNRVLSYMPQSECVCDKARLRAATIEEQLRGPLSLTIELAGECNGNCTYCFQRSLSTFKKPFGFYKALESLILKLGINYVTMLGGEISVQPKTMELMERLAQNHVRIAIITNGAVPLQVEDRLLSMSDDFLITLNGFSERTVGCLSDLPLSRQLEFCEKAVAKTSHVSVRFLITPISIVEIPDFLRWATKMPLEHILLDVAVNTPDNYHESGEWGTSSLKSLDKDFWALPLKRIGEKARFELMQGAPFMAKNNLSLLICEEIAGMLDLNYEFMCKIHAENRLTPKESYISNKVWMKYWRQNQK